MDGIDLGSIAKLETYKEDGRKPLPELYSSFVGLREDGWILEAYDQENFEMRCAGIKLPAISLTTKEKGPALWLIAGVHGEEPAGPNALYDALGLVRKIGQKENKVPIVLFPVCNPRGYLLNQRFISKDRYWDNCHGVGVCDANHLLLDYYGNPRRDFPLCPESEAICKQILKLAKEYPPATVIDLHEDALSPRGYVYSQGKLGKNDLFAEKAVQILEANHIPIVKRGKTRFNERIHNGIIGRVKDSSIDELLAAGQVRGGPGPGAQTVLVVETPIKRFSLEKRKKAHLAVLNGILEMYL